MKPPVVVLGCRGMLGVAAVHQLRHMGFAVTGFSRPQVDALHFDFSALPLARDTVVVNAIGLINRRVGEVPESDFWRVNGLWPRLLADACQRAGAHLIHISTDCVFGGANAPHDEASPADAADLYGASKAAGEPANALVLRSSIIGPELDHHYSLLSWFLGQAPYARVQGFTNHLWNGVTTLELARVIGEIIAAGEHRAPRIQHIHGQDVSKYELLELFKAAFAADVTVEPVAAPQARDMRLATRNRALLERLGVQPMAAQLRALQPLCGTRGEWVGGSA